MGFTYFNQKIYKRPTNEASDQTQIRRSPNHFNDLLCKSQSNPDVKNLSFWQKSNAKII